MIQDCQPLFSAWDLSLCTNQASPHGLFDYTNALGVLLAAVFAGVSAICAWLANSSFKKQANAERFDYLVGNEFLRSFRNVKDHFQKVKSTLISSSSSAAGATRIETAIRVVQNQDIYSNCMRFDECVPGQEKMVSIQDAIDAQLSALADYVTQQPTDWRNKASSCVTNLDSLYAQMSDKYFQTRRIYKE